MKTIWEKAPAHKDFEAAEHYLTLLFGASDVRKLVGKLRACPTVEFQAKDLLRASQTHLLPEDNPHVAADLKKIRRGKKLSPVLLVRGDAWRAAPLTIADGYHRICASWYWNEDCPVACCLAALATDR